MVPLILGNPHVVWPSSRFGRVPLHMGEREREVYICLCLYIKYTYIYIHMHTYGAIESLGFSVCDYGV